MKENPKGLTYKDSGVDIEAKYKALDDSMAEIRSTFTPGVVGEVGGFGGLFRLDTKGLKDPVLVSSTDGVGTKIQVAARAKKHDTIGRDLVNHCVNDIFVQGAKPLFFLDYIGLGLMEDGLVPQIMKGLAFGCRENGCALVGGETAEMPGVYKPGDYDLVGFIVGIVDREKILDGSKVKAGDKILGLPSVGLQTNGYSLARKVFFDRLGLGPHDRIPGMQETVAQALLAPHLSYYPAVYPLVEKNLISAMAHITGGGMIDNIPRVLPANGSAQIRKGSWPVLPIFQTIQKEGGVAEEEMYHIMNMGIGFVLIVPPANVGEITRHLEKSGTRCYEIGEIVPGKQEVLFSR